jgi:hypothetical protein
MFQDQHSGRRHAARNRLAVLGVAVATGAGLPAIGLMAGPANALPNPNCTGFPTVTCTFAAGSAATWAVPLGVTRAMVTADGASGANSVSSFVIGGGAGGAGGEYNATLTNIPAGTSLSIYPGNAASGDTGGDNADGGTGGNSSADTQSDTGGGGGGATTVAVSPFSVGNLLVVAGGGGGGGAENQAANTPANGGIGGGSSTPNGTNGGTGTGSDTNGLGGTTSGAGNGAPAGNGCPNGPDNGGRLLGGDGSSGSGCPWAGGGGGSGYNGGGGGGTGGGGGGGSAYPASATTVDGIHVTPRADSSTNTGNGSVTITYSITAHRTHLRVWSGKSGHVVTLYAQLTGDHGYPIGGAPITFRVFNVTLCSNVATNAGGVASCSLTSRQLLLLQISGGDFSASFAGATGVPAAHATGEVPQYYIY